MRTMWRFVAPVVLGHVATATATALSLPGSTCLLQVSANATKRALGATAAAGQALSDAERQKRGGGAAANVGAAASSPAPASTVGDASAVPASMQRARITGPNPEVCNFSSVVAECPRHFERLQLEDATVPNPPPPGHALVRVLTSSANPTDWKTFMGSSPAFLYPMGFGHDFAGEVVNAGQDCEFALGDVVWGLAATAYQEYLAQDCGRLALKARRHTIREAGALGVVGLTGLQALRWAGAPWRPEAAPTVLVTGGSGGTGHVVIQLAKAMGAGWVITTCSPGNFDFVRRLGADEVIDYQTQEWWEVLANRTVDVIYDCISLPGTGDHAFDVLADGGRFITLLPDARASAGQQIRHPTVRQYFFICNQVQKPQLEMVNAIADRGQLNVSIEHVYHGLPALPQMLDRMMAGHTVGKMSLEVARVVLADG